MPQHDAALPRKQHWLFALALAAMHASADQALLSRETGVNPSKELVQEPFIRDVVVAPIPISNPTIGTGLAVVVMPFYHVGEDSPLSNTIFAAGYTSSGSWGVAAAQSTRLRGDDLRIDGFLGYVEAHYRFFGTGSSAGESGVSVPIIQKGWVFAPELLFLVGARTFLGLRYRGLTVETTSEAGGPLPPAIGAVLPPSLTITSSGLGPRVTFDTRDHDMNPSSGVLAELRANFAEEAFGSEFTYQTYELSGNYY